MLVATSRRARPKCTSQERSRPWPPPAGSRAQLWLGAPFLPLGRRRQRGGLAFRDGRGYLRARVPAGQARAVRGSDRLEPTCGPEAERGGAFEAVKTGDRVVVGGVGGRLKHRNSKAQRPTRGGAGGLPAVYTALTPGRQRNDYNYSPPEPGAAAGDSESCSRPSVSPAAVRL